MKTTSEGQNDQTHHAGRGASDMTDENTTPNKPGSSLRGFHGFLIQRDVENLKPLHGRHNRLFVSAVDVVAPDLDANSKLDEELRKFEFKRRFEKIQFQVREEFKSDAAKIALELQHSEPLTNALSKPGPCDGTMHSKIMPWRQA